MEPLRTADSAADEQSAETAKRRRTQDALIEAAHEVFSEHGLSGATIERLTKAAGFTRGAFYSNFDSKEALMLAVMDRERATATERMARHIEITGDDEDDEEFTIAQLTDTLIDLLTVGASDRDWQLALMEALPVMLRDPALAERQMQIRARAEADTRQLISQGLARLDRRPRVDDDLLVLLLLGLIERTLTDCLLESSLEDFPRRTAGSIATLLISMSDPVDA
jgi:AcrR family transcriptional regulator